MIEIDIDRRILAIVGINGERKSSEEIDQILAKRKESWEPKAVKYKSGALRLFSELAVSPMKGAYISFDEK